jgi:hypothetical protein
MTTFSAPDTTTCCWCGGVARRSVSSRRSFEIYAYYRCDEKSCGKITSKLWPILDHDDYPRSYECPSCRRTSYPQKANDDGTVTYRHDLDSGIIHLFNLMRNDQGWGTYQPRDEIVRVYETTYDCHSAAG